MSSLFLPTSKKEVDALGWDQLDVILFMGDAYVDHPSFGVSVIARVLEAKGYKVARRTIAKYRSLLDIPKARLRREL